MSETTLDWTSYEVDGRYPPNWPTFYGCAEDVG